MNNHAVQNTVIFCKAKVLVLMSKMRDQNTTSGA